MAGVDAWGRVGWTEARQVVALMEEDDAVLPDAAVTPAAHFADLRGAGRDDDALAFLGHALPRLEALAWACTVLDGEARGRSLPPADRQALDHALRWLDQPSDAFRRATWRAGQKAHRRAPERALAAAVFFSGGSISEPDLPPVLPTPELAGRYAAGAVRMAALRSERTAEVRARAMDLGTRLAAGGMEALNVR